MSLLCVPVEGPGGPAGTLTAVRRPGRPWPAQEAESLHVYAGVVASLVRAAVVAERDAQVIGQLEHALHHRVVIEQAKGILMEREQLDPAGAFDRLRKAARARRRRVSTPPRSSPAIACPRPRTATAALSVMMARGPTATPGGSHGVLYTAEATATGGRKNGRAWSSDGAIDVQINPPKEVGGPARAPTPNSSSPPATPPVSTTPWPQSPAWRSSPRARPPSPPWSPSPNTQRAATAWRLSSEFAIPDLARDQAEDLLAKAHRRCPYSRATKGNIEVRLTLV